VNVLSVEDNKNPVGRPKEYTVKMKKWTCYAYEDLYKALKILSTIYPEKYALNQIGNRLFLNFLNELPEEETEKLRELYPHLFGGSLEEIEKQLRNI
jgi:hypothetical protein